MPGPRTRTTTLSMAGIVLLIVAGVFWPVIDFEFLHYDDDIHIFENAYVLGQAPAVDIWTRTVEGLYIPVTYALWIGLAGGSEPSASDFHRLNLVLHLAAVAVCMLLVHRLLVRRHESTRDPTESTMPRRSVAVAITGAVVGLHPVAVESVAWASESKGLLAAIFGWSALWLALSRQRRFRAGSSVAFALAVASKPSAVALIAAGPCLEQWIRDADSNAAWRERLVPLTTYLPWLLIAVPVIVATKDAQHAQSSWILEPLSVWKRPFIACDALRFHVQNILVPWSYYPDYGYLPAQRFETWAAWLATSTVTAAAISCWRWPKLRPAGWLALAIACCLAPNLGLVPFSFQRWSTVADRYAYLSLTVFAVGLAWPLYTTRRRGPVFATLVFCLICGMQTRRGLPAWRDDAQLFGHALTWNPDSAFFRYNAGRLADNHGDWQRARAHYERTLELEPRHGGAATNLGVLWYRQGRLDRAEEYFERAVAIDPGFDIARRNLEILRRQRSRP